MGILGLALVVGIFAESPAHAGEPEKTPDRAQCADSYKNAQVQRKSGALKRARESLLVCVSDKCPSVLQPDCLRWLTEVEAAMPTMTFAAKGVDGKDVTDVRVSLDGQPLAGAFDGKAISIDPGTHALHFEHGTEAPIDQQVVVREGEKSRVVSVSWAKPLPIAEAPTSAPEITKSGPPTASWVLGGVGAASLVAFGVLGVHGMTRRSDLEKECYGSCSNSSIDSIKTEFAIADIALGAGIVAVGAAAVVWLASGPTTEKPVIGHDLAFGIAPQKSGAAVGVGGKF